MSAEEIVNVAKFVWEVIKDGAPSAEITTATANAVPHVDDWQTITGTRGPNSYKIPYNASYVWPFDDYDHVQIDIRLKWEFGARYKGGGAFIPNIWVEVPECFVGWPWKVNIGLTVHNPSNVGQAGAPIASVPVTLSGTVSSGAELETVQWGFMLLGDGSSRIT